MSMLNFAFFVAFGGILAAAKECYDAYSSSKCQRWSDDGLCTENWMRLDCRKTCGYCENQEMSAPACEDIMPTVFCIMVNKAGGCELSPQAKQDCKKTCGLCGENDYEYDENVDCVWSEWQYGECSVECGGGFQPVTRVKTQLAAFGGVECQGEGYKEEECNTHPCSVDCTWNDWELGDCSVTCGGGTRIATRTVATNAMYGGTCDPEFDVKVEHCNTDDCPLVNEEMVVNEETVVNEEMATAKPTPGGRVNCGRKDPVWNKVKCPNWPFRRLERHRCNPGHGDVCRHAKWPKNMNFKCPKGCKKINGPPFCKRGRKACRV